jgi:tetraacyldisaccharide 4'-kinase
MNLIRIILLPVAILYGLAAQLRNKLFDWGVLPSKSFDHPVISVGNLSMGGTGKTPHIEYLINLLKNYYKVAVLSRGYKRKSKGFQVVSIKSDVDHAGDEPLQMCLKHPEAFIAVAANRVKGINEILKTKKNNQVILLDDAFQHRYVSPGLNILLTDYHRIFSKNFVLPTGNLREFRRGASRADLLVVTKTPLVFSPLDRKLLLKNLEKYKIKNILFSFIKYGDWVPVTPCAKELALQKARTIFLLTGIANPTPLGEHLKRQCDDLIIHKFGDHHQFTQNEILSVMEKFNQTYGGKKVIITTEKDSMRLRDPKLAKLIRNLPVYYVPIEVDFHGTDKTKFDKIVLEYMSSYWHSGELKPKK